jgi:O-succinylbenzoic acid--CoA ligase
VRLAPDGEILVRGPCLFEGYWENGKIDLLVDKEGWFATGDLGSYSPTKGLKIIGRKDWQFISGGENIQPEEIERELLSLPGILEAIVVPIPDPEFGHRPVACIRCADPSFDLRQMRNVLLSKLPKYKIPISLHIFDELPKHGLKVDRRRVIEIAINRTRTLF